MLVIAHCVMYCFTSSRLLGSRQRTSSPCHGRGWYPGYTLDFKTLDPRPHPSHPAPAPYIYTLHLHLGLFTPDSTSHTLHPAPYSLQPIPYTPQPIPRTLKRLHIPHPTSCTLQPIPYTLYPTPYTPHPAPYIPALRTHSPTSRTKHSTPRTLYPTPHTRPPPPYGDVIENYHDCAGAVVGVHEHHLDSVHLKRAAHVHRPQPLPLHPKPAGNATSRAECAVSSQCGVRSVGRGVRGSGFRVQGSECKTSEVGGRA